MVHVDGRVEYQGIESMELSEHEIQHATQMANSRDFLEPIGEIDPDALEQKTFAPPPTAPPVEEPTPFVENDPTRLIPPDLVPPPKEGSQFALPEDEVPSFDAYDENADFGTEAPPPVPEGEEGMELQAAAESDQAAVEQQAEPAAKLDENLDFTFDQSEPEPPAAVYNSAPAANSPDLSDVAAFGNSDISGGRDGNLRYNLIIEGIDTTDVRTALREALTDRKFMWDIDQILRSIRNGKVNIPNVAPTKAYILISRLRGMPVRVRWEQYAIQQT